MIDYVFFRPRHVPIVILLLFSSVAFISCGFGDLTLTAQFSEIGSLLTGDRILLQNQNVGDVEKISRDEEGHYLVKLDIDSDYKKQLTVDSIFYIDKDPDHPNRKAVFAEQTKPGGTLLTDNSMVIGLDRPPVMRHMLQDLSSMTEELASKLAEKLSLARQTYEEPSKALALQMENTLTQIDRQMREFEKTVQTAPDSEQTKELERNLEKMVDDMQTKLGEIANAIGQDLSNRLQKSLDNLKHRLDELKVEGQKGEGGIKV